MPRERVSIIQCTSCVLSSVDDVRFFGENLVGRRNVYAREVTVLPGEHQLTIQFGKGEFSCNSHSNPVDLVTVAGETYKIRTKIKCNAYEVVEKWIWVIEHGSGKLVFGEEPR